MEHWKKSLTGSTHSPYLEPVGRWLQNFEGSIFPAVNPREHDLLFIGKVITITSLYEMTLPHGEVIEGNRFYEQQKTLGVSYLHNRLCFL